MVEKVSGILLAGGKSKRMGRDKRFVEYEGQNLIDKSVKRLRAVTDEIVIVTAGPESLEVENVKLTHDISPGKGPMMAIYSGLMAMTGSRALVNAVDTPNLTEELLEYLIRLSSGSDVVMPERRGRLEPLVACYSKNVIPVVKNMLKEGSKTAPHDLADERNGLKIRVVREEELKEFGDPDYLFLNVNSPGDLPIS